RRAAAAASAARATDAGPDRRPHCAAATTRARRTGVSGAGARVARVGRRDSGDDDRRARERRRRPRAAVDSAARSGRDRRGAAMVVHADAAERRGGAGRDDRDGQLHAGATLTAALRLGEEARERRAVDVAAAHHAHDALAGESIAQLLRRRDRRRAGAFSQVVRRSQRSAHAVGQLRFGERDDLVELALQDGEWQIERDARRHPFGERVGLLAADALRAAPRSRERVGALGLDADDFGAAAGAAARNRAAAGAAAAANRHEDHVDVRRLFDDLETVGADAGDEQRLDGRVDVPPRTLGEDLLEPLARLVEVAAVFDQLRAQRAHRRVLLGIVAERHDDRARYPFALTRERNRLPVIARRRGDDADAAFLGRQAANQVEAAAHLDRAGRVVVLVLDADVEAEFLVEQRMAQQRRRLETAVD